MPTSVTRHNIFTISRTFTKCSLSSMTGNTTSLSTIGLDWAVFRPRQHSVGYMGDGVYIINEALRVSEWVSEWAVSLSHISTITAPFAMDVLENIRLRYHSIWKQLTAHFMHYTMTRNMECLKYTTVRLWPTYIILYDHHFIFTTRI